MFRTPNPSPSPMSRCFFPFFSQGPAYVWARIRSHSFTLFDHPPPPLHSVSALSHHSFVGLCSLHSLRPPSFPPSPPPHPPRLQDAGIDDGPAAVARLIEGKLNIIVLLAFAPTGRHVICAALRAGPDLLFGRQHAWVLMGHNPGGWWKRDASDKHDCSDDELRQAVQGYLVWNDESLKYSV